MLILLPPSEGKTPPTSGPILDLDSLSDSELTAHRRKVLDALVEVSGRPDALETLGVGQRIAPEVAANTVLSSAATARAAEVYSGVLFTAAGFDSPALPEYAQERLQNCVRVVSALWGTVSPCDLIPAYRLAMGVNLPGIGSLAQFWREPLASVLEPRAEDDVVIDCRSASYVAAWRPHPGQDVVSVKVLRELNGKRSVVSHNAKHTRGVLAGHLVARSGPEPRNHIEVLAAAQELIGSHLVDAQLLPGRRSSFTLELIVS